MYVSNAQEFHLDAIIHVLRVEVEVARGLPHVCLGHMGCVQQLVTIPQMVFLQGQG